MLNQIPVFLWSFFNRLIDITDQFFFQLFLTNKIEPHGRRLLDAPFSSEGQKCYIWSLFYYCCCCYCPNFAAARKFLSTSPPRSKNVYQIQLTDRKCLKTSLSIYWVNTCSKHLRNYFLRPNSPAPLTDS